VTPVNKIIYYSSINIINIINININNIIININNIIININNIIINNIIINQSILLIIQDKKRG